MSVCLLSREKLLKDFSVYKTVFVTKCVTQSNISSIVEFQIWWILKSKLFGQESTCYQEKIFKKFLRVMTVCQTFGVILESKVVQKLSLEKKVFNK